jgi:hypothetical protein
VAPEAPCKVGGTASPTYTYDANGNMLTGAGRTVTYTAANMTHTVNQGANNLRRWDAMRSGSVVERTEV